MLNIAAPRWGHWHNSMETDDLTYVAAAEPMAPVSLAHDFLLRPRAFQEAALAV